MAGAHAQQAIRALRRLPRPIVEDPSILIAALRTQYLKRQAYVKYIVSTKQQLVITREASHSRPASRCAR